MSSIASSEIVQGLIDNNEASFRYFPKLPLELRLMVWEEALPGPRIIPFVSKLSQKKFSTPVYGVVDPKPVLLNPAMLFANQESRSVALSIYEAAFHHRSSKPVFFNFAEDTLFFRTERDLLEFTTSGRQSRKVLRKNIAENKKVKNVIIGITPGDIYIPWYGYRYNTDSMCPIFRRIAVNHKNLRSLTLTAGDLERPLDPNVLETYMQYHKTVMLPFKAKFSGTTSDELEINSIELDGVHRILASDTVGNTGTFPTRRGVWLTLPL